MRMYRRLPASCLALCLPKRVDLGQDTRRTFRIATPAIGGNADSD